MDGAPVRGESIPIRVFLAGYDLAPTMRDINKKFSVRYYLNLVLMDEEDRRYFKQQVGHLCAVSLFIRLAKIIVLPFCMLKMYIILLIHSCIFILPLFFIFCSGDYIVEERREEQKVANGLATHAVALGIGRNRIPARRCAEWSTVSAA